MKNKPIQDISHEYKSIRYLNLFRLLLSFFFFSAIFKGVSGLIGYRYTLEIAKFIASVYLSFSILIWIASVAFKSNSVNIGMIALIADLPFIIALALLFDGLNNGWVILPAIIIGSFSILSHITYQIVVLPVLASILLWIFPHLLHIDPNTIDTASKVIYSLTYFAIAFVGVRHSQTYNQSLQLNKRQKEKIIDLSQINKLVIDQMQSGVIAFDQRYSIILINSKAKEIFKLSQKQKIPTNIIKKIISTPDSENKSITVHGEDVVFYLVNREESSGLNLLFIEEQKQINEKSQQINLATLGQLSATIAHELRNPMASIYSAAQLLQESPDIVAENKQLTDIVVKQVERSNEIIEDILLMSKPHVANQREILLFENLNRFKDEFCPQHTIDYNQFNIECPDQMLKINFDKNHLNQLFWNLTENAIKHGNGKNISIVISNEEEKILIDFKNDGEAFEPIVEESLFTPFFTTHTQGTGLGLYICREMCRSNGGKLEYLRLEFQHVFRIHVRK